jgi:replicative DNA helicase
MRPAAMDRLSFLGPEHFSNDVHALVYKAMMELHGANEGIDQITVYEATGREPAALEALTASSDKAVSSFAVETHGKQIVTAFTRRQIHLAAETIQAQCMAEQDLYALISASQSLLSDAVQGTSLEEPKPLRDVIAGVMEHVDKGPQSDILLRTGIDGLDDFCGGLPRGLLTILAARPGAGKTTVALNMIANMGGAGMRVLLTSLEDTAHFVGVRMLSRHAQIGSMKINRATLTREERDILASAAQGMPLNNVYIDDKPGRSPQAIRHMALTVQKKYGLDALFVDHLGEMTDEEKSYASTSKNVRLLRDLAKELDIPVLLVSQLNRSVESRQDKRPMMSDLRDSGRIEEMARQIIFLYRPGYYDETADPFELEALIAKSSHGKTGTVQLEINLDKMEVR